MNQAVFLIKNSVGAIGGGIVGNIVAKKVFRVKNKFGILAITVGGIIVGAMIENKMWKR